MGGNGLRENLMRWSRFSGGLMAKEAELIREAASGGKVAGGFRSIVNNEAAGEGGAAEGELVFADGDGDLHGDAFAVGAEGEAGDVVRHVGGGGETLAGGDEGQGEIGAAEGIGALGGGAVGELEAGGADDAGLALAELVENLVHADARGLLGAIELVVHIDGGG
jgi:hypothetical protein